MQSSFNTLTWCPCLERVKCPFSCFKQNLKHPGAEQETNCIFLAIAQQQEFLVWMSNSGPEACKSILTALQLVLKEY